MKLFGIKNCDTVKKAMRWLDQHQVPYQFHDFRKDGLDQPTIELWLNSVSWEQLNQQSAVELMLTHPTLIKRPVIEDASGVSIGFNESDFQARYAK